MVGGGGGGGGVVIMIASFTKTFTVQSKLMLHLAGTNVLP